MFIIIENENAQLYKEDRKKRRKTEHEIEHHAEEIEQYDVQIENEYNGYDTDEYEPIKDLEFPLDMVECFKLHNGASYKGSSLDWLSFEGIFDFLHIIIIIIITLL